jgi:hypothetical protein
MKSKKNKNTTTTAIDLPAQVQEKADEEAVTVCADTKQSASGSDDPEYFAERAREKGFDEVGPHRVDQTDSVDGAHDAKDRDWIASQTKSLSTSQEPKGAKADDVK